MVDFKIKGTKLPVIPKKTEVRCTHWTNDSNNGILYLSVNVFSKTGCQNVETKLSDWKQVYETYKNMQ